MLSGKHCMHRWQTWNIKDIKHTFGLKLDWFIQFDSFLWKYEKMYYYKYIWIDLVCSKAKVSIVSEIFLLMKLPSNIMYVKLKTGSAWIHRPVNSLCKIANFNLYSKYVTYINYKRRMWLPFFLKWNLSRNIKWSRTKLHCK